MDSYQVVAVGEFVDFPEEAAGDLSPQAPREIVVAFEVSRFYQGYIPYDRIQIRLAADMLRYPGANIARYNKRLDVRLQQGERHKELEQQLMDLRESHQNGSVTGQEFREQEEELLALQQSLVAESVATGGRMIGAINFKTFYDLGGAIRPNEQYLVGLNGSPEDTRVFILDEFPNVENILWGQTRDDIAAALDRIATAEQ